MALHRIQKRVGNFLTTILEQRSDGVFTNKPALVVEEQVSIPPETLSSVGIQVFGGASGAVSERVVSKAPGLDMVVKAAIFAAQKLNGEIVLELSGYGPLDNGAFRFFSNSTYAGAVKAMLGLPDLVDKQAYREMFREEFIDGLSIEPKPVEFVMTKKDERTYVVVQPVQDTPAFRSKFGL